MKEQLARETARLIQEGKSPFFASIKAGQIVHARQRALAQRRNDALATHCNDT